MVTMLIPSPNDETARPASRRRALESRSNAVEHRATGRALPDVDTSRRDPLLPVVCLRPAYRRPAPIRTRSSCAIWIRLPDVSFV